MIGVFNKRNLQQENPDVTEYSRKLAALEEEQRNVYINIGRTYAEKNILDHAKGTPYAEFLEELNRIVRETKFYEKRRLAVQILRKCEKCGNILALDGAYCNKCGEKLVPLFQADAGEQSVCSKCGTPWQEGEKFCANCGSMLNPEESK